MVGAALVLNLWSARRLTSSVAVVGHGPVRVTQGERPRVALEVRALRALAPNAIIIANCTPGSKVAPLKAAGADHVFRMATEVALGILPAIYAALNANLGSYHAGLVEQHGAVDAPEVLN